MTGLTTKRLLSIALAVATLAVAEPAAASGLRVSTGSAQRAANEVEATSHVLISETARESVPITVFFDPQVTGVESTEVFTNTNLNRETGQRPTPMAMMSQKGSIRPLATVSLQATIATTTRLIQ